MLQILTANLRLMRQRRIGVKREYPQGKEKISLTETTEKSLHFKFTRNPSVDCYLNTLTFQSIAYVLISDVYGMRI